MLREILLQAARSRNAEAGSDNLGTVPTHDTLEDALIQRLIEREVITQKPSEQECERYYQNNSAKFRSGTLVEASHILFQVTPTLPLEALRAKAEEILQELVLHPERFEAFARTYSNCPSAEQGGNLGQLPEGRSVPEIEQALFALNPGQISSRLVESRFGFHIIRVRERIEGREIPFQMVHKQIAAFLTDRVRMRAIKQYLDILVGQADIQGIEIKGAQTPLVQ